MSSRELDRAHAALNLAIDNNGGTTCRRLSADFTDVDQPPADSLYIAGLCRRCPVLEECSALADLLPHMTRAHTVMAGTRYDGTGHPVDLHEAIARDKAARDAARDRRLAQLAELVVDQVDDVDEVAA